MIKSDDLYYKEYPKNIKGYSFINVIGFGAYGVVCKYEKDDQYFAIKLENAKS